MKNTTPNFITLGRINGPHIDIIARPGCKRQVKAEDAVNIIIDPRTLWQTIENIREDLDDEEILVLSKLKMDLMIGFYGYIEGNTMEDETITPISVFFYYPPGLTPEEALKVIEIHVRGNISPSLAIGLLAIAHFFLQGGQVMYAMHVGFIYLGGVKPAHGISYLSEKSIDNLIKKYFDELVEHGASLEPYLPDNSVDRARFMLKLGEFCWKPVIRRKIAHGREYMKQVLPLLFLATPWLYLNPGARISQAGINFSLKYPYESNLDRFQQFLEWEEHVISSTTLAFLLPPKNKPIEFFDFNGGFDLHDKAPNIVADLTKILLTDIVDDQEFTPRSSRFLLPECTFFKMLNMTAIRMDGSPKDGCWIGIETPSGISISFWWRLQDEMPMGWVSSAMNGQIRNFIHLTLVCLWHDIARGIGTHFPLISEIHYTGVGLRSWGEEKEIKEIDGNERRVLSLSRNLFRTASTPDIAREVFNLANNAFSPGLKITGRGSLALLMELAIPESGGF